MTLEPVRKIRMTWRLGYEPSPGVILLAGAVLYVLIVAWFRT